MDTKEIETLLQRGESKNTDFKAAGEWAGDYRVKLTKSLAAMANTRDGGVLIVGIDDNRTSGVHTVTGLDHVELSSFDPTTVAQHVNSHFSPDIHLRVEKHDVGGKNIVAIVVSEFDSEPLICIKEGVYQTKTQFKPGDLLIRSAAAETKLVSPKELRELLGRAVAKKGDSLLSQFQAILAGRPSQNSKLENHSAEVAVFDQSRASAFADFKKNSLKDGWSFRLFPAEITNVPKLSHQQLIELLRSASVNLRGWSFVPTDSSITNYNNRIHCNISYSRGERWDLFDNLCFSDVRPHFEDEGFYGGEGHHGDVISMQNITHSIAEFLLFSHRLLTKAQYVGNVELQIKIHGCKDRYLIAPGRHLFGTYKAAEDEIPLNRTVSTVDLASNREGLASDAIAKVFSLFNWNNFSEEQILTDIRQLEKRAT